MDGLYNGSCLADPAPDNPVCDAAEKAVRGIENDLLALISRTRDTAARHPDFAHELNYLADVFEGDRTDWLHGDVMAAIRDRRER